MILGFFIICIVFSRKNESIMGTPSTGREGLLNAELRTELTLTCPIFIKDYVEPGKTRSVCPLMNDHTAGRLLQDQKDVLQVR
jgi:hypothetical protein